MSFLLSRVRLVESRAALGNIPEGKILITTVNAHSYNLAQKDDLFAEALLGGDYLIPDGAGIVMACGWLGISAPEERVAGWDLFCFDMQRVAEAKEHPCVMFMGSTPEVLSRIEARASKDYPGMKVVTFSPPFKEEFSDEDSAAMVAAINDAKPDLLWIGMTAPKQEKWVWTHWDELEIDCHTGTVGAVFDFYSGTIRRAPKWWQDHSLEWLFRLIHETRHTWKRYLLGNPLFVWNILKEKHRRNA